MKAFIGLLALFAVGAIGTPRADASPDPYAIYGRARAYWQAARYPANLAYTVVVRVRERGVEKVEHFSSRYDARHDEIHTSGLSSEELAHPHFPPGGFNIRVKFFGINRPEDPVDYLGVPLLAPNFSFGIAKYAPAADTDSSDLVRQIREQYHDPAPPSGAPPVGSGLKEIGSVEAIARDYDIRLAGLDSIGGHPDYHLTMKPIRSPQRYRLRDVWVNTLSYATDKLVTDGNFTDGPGAGSRWAVTFSQVGSTPYIAIERAESPLKVDGRTYDDATIAFTEISSVPRSAIDALATFTTARGTLEEP